MISVEYHILGVLPLFQLNNGIFGNAGILDCLGYIINLIQSGRDLKVQIFQHAVFHSHHRGESAVSGTSRNDA